MGSWERKKNYQITPANRRFPIFSKLNPKTLLLLTTFTIILLPALYFYTQWRITDKKLQESSQQLNENEDEVEKEINGLIARVEEIVQLPEGEVPTLITVRDASQISENKDFFVNAKDGDKVLVYERAQKAFLYRPDTNKLINLAPITPKKNITSPPPAVINNISSKFNAEGAEILIRNGTNIPGASIAFQEQLEEKFDNLIVTGQETAAHTNYRNSLLIPVSLDNLSLAKQIANQFDISVSELPAKELSDVVDIIIIVGGDLVSSETSSIQGSSAGLELSSDEETTNSDF